MALKTVAGRRPAAVGPYVTLLAAAMVCALLCLASGRAEATTASAGRVLGLDWRVANDRAALVIGVAGRPAFAVRDLDGEPPLLVVDVLGSPLPSGLVLPLTAGEAGLRRVSWEHQAGSGLTRIVLELEAPVSYRVRFDALTSCVLVEIDYQVIRVAHEGEGNDSRLLIETNGPVSYHMVPPGGNGRLVIDVPCAGLSPHQPAGSFAVRGSPVRRVTVTAGQPGGVRIAVDVDPTVVPYPVHDGRGLQITFTPRVRKVSLRMAGGAPQLVVLTTTRVGVQAAFLLRPARLVLDLQGASLALDVPPELEGVGAVTAVSVTQQTDPLAVRIVVGLGQYAGHVANWSQAGTVLRVDFPLPDLRGVVVAVDAGHGGYDPGALSRSGLQEKDVTLDLALALGARLRQAGATVVQTRTEDVFVSNERRAEIANTARARVLISIHLNSYRDPSVRGAETYYSRVNRGGAGLAEHLQASLVERTGLWDRGLRTEEFVVLREAAMPAAMVEALYLSSPDDAALVADPAFRERLVEGIFAGLLSYLAVHGKR